MKRKLKLLLVLLAVFCAALTLGLVTACIDEEPDGPPDDSGNPAKDGYVITVLYPDGSPVKNTDGDKWYYKPSVELTDAEGNRIDPAATSQINASGIAYINYMVPGEYYIKLTDYPSGYNFDNTSVKTSADRAYYTVSLKLGPPTPYKVNLVEPDDETPIPNVTVKLMKDTQTVATATTDENGNATTEAIERGVYGIVLENLPKGFGYKAVSTTVAAFDTYITTVVLKDITFEDEDKLNSEGIKPWNEALNEYSLNLVRFDKNGDCYSYTAEYEAGQEVFFKIHAPKAGAYTIGSKEGNDYEIQFYNDELTYVDNSLTISSATNSGNNIQRIQIEKDKTLIFSVRAQNRNSDKAGQVELLVCLPVPTPVVTEATKVGEVTLTFEELNTAILNFVTSTVDGQGFGMGTYRLTSLSDKYDLMLIECSSATGNPISGESDLTGEYAGYSGNDNGAGDGRNFVFNNSFPTEYLGNTIPYRIIIKDENATLPTQIKIKIERTGDAITTQTTKKVASTTVNTNYGNQSGTFTWCKDTNDTLTPYRKDDGKWYVSVNGEEKALVVAITKNLSGYMGEEYSFASIEYLADGKTHKDRVNSYLTVYEDLTKRDTTWNYTGFIEQYSKFVNNDGVYQVNDELKLFLERYMNQHFHELTGSNSAPDQPWLLGCGYYATDNPEA